MSETRHERWSAHHSHRHPYREILVPLSGNTVYGVNGTIYPCKPGCVFFLDARDVHDVFYPAFAPELEHLWITVLQGRYIVRWVKAGQGRQDMSAGFSLTLSKADASVCLNGCWPESNAADLHDNVIYRARLISALVLLLANIAQADFSGNREDKEGVQKKSIEAIKEHIWQTAGNGATLDGLARITGYSKFHFLRLFKHHTGQSVHDFIDGCRVQRVLELLRQGCSQKEIAYVLGFSGASAFSRWYKAQGRPGR